MRDLVAYTWPTPGLTMATAEWFHAHDVAAVATDTMVLEVYPCESEDLYLPVHLLHLVEMGMTQGQNWFLDELADACDADGRYDVLAGRHPAAVHQRPGLTGQSGCAALISPLGRWPRIYRGGLRFADALPEAAALTSAVRAEAAPPPTTGPVRGNGPLEPATSAPSGAGRPVTAQCSRRAWLSTSDAVRIPQNSNP